MIVEEVETEIDQGASSGLAINLDVRLQQVPSTRTHQKSGGLAVKLVCLVAGLVLVGDGPVDSVTQVDLPVHDVVPGWRQGVFEVGHEHLGSAVEGVDDHLALHGAGDLHSPVGDGGRGWGARPVALADGLAGRVEAGKLPGVVTRLLLLPALEDVLHARSELALQRGHKLQRLLREHLLEPWLHGAPDAHSGWVRRLNVADIPLCGWDINLHLDGMLLNHSAKNKVNSPVKN